MSKIAKKKKIKKYSVKKKKKKILKKSVKGKTSAALIFLWDLIVEELARKEYSIFPSKLWGSLKNFRVEKLSFSLASKVILTLALNFGLLLWLGSSRTIIANELEKGSRILIPDVQEALAAETANNEAPPDNSANNNEVFNGYLINTPSFSKKQCEEAQKGRKNSELCGQDQVDEATVAELESLDKEYQKQYAKEHASRKPIVRKISCREENDHPSYSETKGKHVDEDCCPDPDEWPKPGCVYSAAGYAIMLKGKPH